MGFLSQPMDSVGADVHVICLPGRATEDRTSPAVLILQMNSRMFVSYIRAMYLKLRNVKVKYFIYCMKFPFAFWVSSLHFRAVT